MVKKQKNINEKEITDLIILIYQKEKCKTLTHTQICNKIIKENYMILQIKLIILMNLLKK
jgi:hypothetical protein